VAQRRLVARQEGVGSAEGSQGHELATLRVWHDEALDERMPLDHQRPQERGLHP
jgi:hypothetical protein